MTSVSPNREYQEGDWKILKCKIYFLELKSAITKMKNSIKGLNNRLEVAKKRISELEDMSIEITQAHTQREWEKKRIEHPRDLGQYEIDKHF